MQRKAGQRDYLGMDQEDYLHVIYHLEEQVGAAHISAIAEKLGVRKPSVSQMAERLAREGQITYQPYRDIALTGKGRRAALAIHKRREALVAFFTALGVPKNVQTHDIHGLEHYLSPITLKKIEEATKLLKRRAAKKN